MAYSLLFNTQDTLAATLNSGATSTTLTTGNFGSPTGTQLYVVDYDVPAKAEIISATVATTAVTSITRGLPGGAAGTTDHAIGAKIGSIFVPQHYANGLGAIAAGDAWTAYTPSWTSSGTQPTIGNGSIVGSYQSIGKSTFFRVLLTFGSTTTIGTGVYIFTYPVATKSTYNQYTVIGSAGDIDAGTGAASGFCYHETTTTFTCGVVAATTAAFNQWGATNPQTFANGDKIIIQGYYEAA